MADKIEFTEEQQAFVDDLVGKARTKARDKAVADAIAQTTKDKEAAEQAALVAEKKWQELASKHEARVKQLEPYEASAKAYDELVAKMLEDKVKELSEAGKKAVKALPDSMTATEKLAWLNANEGLFQAAGDGVGTPGHSKLRPEGDKGDGRRIPRRITSL